MPLIALSLMALRGDWQGAEPLARHAHEEFTALAAQPYTHEDVIQLSQAATQLAHILRCGGKHAEADEVCRVALQSCHYQRRANWSDSRDIRRSEANLNVEMGELALEAGQFSEAETYFRAALELKRDAFKAGRDPVSFYVNFLFKDGPPLASNNELTPFCDYAETELRLARALARQGRPYAAELALGKTTLTADVLSGTDQDSLRYRVARANAWAEVALLLSDQRPDESQVAQQWSAAIWRDTLARFPQAIYFRSGLHDPETDVAWFNDQFPSLLGSAPAMDYEPYQPAAIIEMPYFLHAAGMAFYEAGEWGKAKDAFEHAAKSRTSGQAFDWLRLAMVCWHLEDFEAARRWYELALSSADTNHELMALCKEAERLLRAGES